MATPFQALTVTYRGIADRIFTEIGVSEAFDPKAPPDPRPKTEKATALWDTGANKSVISPTLVVSLGLTPVGKAIVGHAGPGGKSESPTYMVNFALPNGVGISGALVTELDKQHVGNFQVIVGMDVITLGDFSITNAGGLTMMSFRTPSLVAIDYVAEAHRAMFAGVGRNDPCPCQSGKKYKKCHGA